VNEDCFAIDERASLCVVADGMGGHNAGEVAARIAVTTLVDLCGSTARCQESPWPFGFDPGTSEAGNLLRTAVHTANIRILELAGASPDHVGMGTTIVAAIVRDGLLSVAHVGDSRLYLRTSAGLRRLTRDDSWMERLLAENPAADRAMLRLHPMRGALTNVVGADTPTEVHIFEESLSDDTVLLLTTDGVHGVVDDQGIDGFLSEGGNTASVAAKLVGAALARGTRDNCTAIVARYRVN